MDFAKKLREALISVSPVVAIVLILHFFFAPLPPAALRDFLLGAVLVIIGLGVFLRGVDMGVEPIGKRIGAAIIIKRDPWLVVAAGLVIGVAITVAEPDLQILAEQVFQVTGGAVAKAALVWLVGLGVGLFIAFALFRIMVQFSLRKSILLGYVLVFGAGALASAGFVPLAFDSGGVTTGAMTVPFMLSLGLGVSSIRADKSSEEDSFGIVGLASIGPILTCMVMGIISRFGGRAFAGGADGGAAYGPLWAIAAESAREVGLSLLPMTAVFLLFNAALLRLKRPAFVRVLAGLVYTFIGLFLFITGINVGFMPAGGLLGSLLAEGPRWIVIAVGFALGLAVVLAEPAVAVLSEQVYKVSAGSIGKKALLISLSIGVGIAVALAMTRIVFGFSIWWYIVPGYAVSFALMKATPRVFTAIAFDSGGVASGPMTASFILAFAMGAAGGINGDMMASAFGTVAMVAMIPLIAIQVLGLIYKRTERTGRAEAESASGAAGDEIEIYDTNPDYTP